MDAKQQAERDFLFSAKLSESIPDLATMIGRVLYAHGGTELCGNASWILIIGGGDSTAYASNVDKKTVVAALEKVLNRMYETDEQGDGRGKPTAN